MDLTVLKFRVSGSCNDLLLTAKLDNEIIYRGCLTPESQEISQAFPDDEAEHFLSFSMSGKTAEHTKIDNLGNIISDHCITITDLSFDNIPLGHVFTELAVYEHDFNGTRDRTSSKFYGEMGCNGTVTLKFTTPIYLWFLENM